MVATDISSLHRRPLLPALYKGWAFITHSQMQKHISYPELTYCIVSMKDQCCYPSKSYRTPPPSFHPHIKDWRGSVVHRNKWVTFYWWDCSTCKEHTKNISWQDFWQDQHVFWALIEQMEHFFGILIRPKRSKEGYFLQNHPSDANAFRSNGDISQQFGRRWTFTHPRGRHGRWSVSFSEVK